MPRMLWVAPLFAAALIAVAARGESPGDWSVHASVRWDLGAVEDVDYIGDTGLLLVLDPAQNPDGSAGFVVWDPATKRVARTILADVAGIVVHTVSADGSRIAGASATAVKVWDATTGEELLVLERAGARRPEANSVALSRDGGRLAAAVGGSRVEVWDVATREQLVAVTADPLAGCVGISLDGHLLFAAGVRHHRVRTWDIATGTELNVYGGYERRVRSIAFDDDGRTMVTGSGDGSVAVWDLSTGRRTHTFNAVEGPVASVSVKRDMAAVAVGGVRGGAVLFDVSGDEPREVHRLATSGPANVSLRHDSAALAVASGGLQLWPGDPATTPQVGKRSYAWGGSPRVNASGTRALTTHGNRTVTLWDLERGAILATFPAPATANEPKPNAFASRYVFTAFAGDVFRIVHHTGDVLVCDASSGEIRSTFAIRPLYAHRRSFSAGLTRFADIDDTGRAEVWDLEEGRLVGTYAAESTGEARAMSVRLSPRGHALAVTAGRGQATVWDLRRGRGPWTVGEANALPRHIPPRRPDGHPDAVEQMLHVADDAVALVALTHGRVEVWDVSAGSVAVSSPTTGGRSFPGVRLLPGGGALALVISYPSWLWSSEEPFALQPLTVVPDEPLAFDANGQLTQDFRAPRDDLTVVYWPGLPGADAAQSAGRRSRDGSVALTFVGSRGFDVWRLAPAPHMDDMPDASDVGNPAGAR